MSHNSSDLPACVGTSAYSVIPMPSTKASSESEVVFTIPEELVPSRNDEFQPTISLDFDGSLELPLILKQDLKEGCGGKTWPAGMVLAEYFLRCKLDTLHSKTMFVRSRLAAFQRGRRSILDGFCFLTRADLDLSSDQVVDLLGMHLFFSRASIGRKTANTF